MIFECRAVSGRDQDGLLDGCGARWTEAFSAIEWLLAKAAECSLLSAGVVTVGGTVYGAMHGGFAAGLAGLPLVAVAWGMAWLSVRCPGRERELTFWQDGVGYAPRGLSPWRWGCERMPLPHWEVASIEAVRLFPEKPDALTHYTHGVIIYFNGGEVSRIAEHLEPDQAHMVAVKLTIALRKLRESMATASRTNHNAAQRVVID